MDAQTHTHAHVPHPAAPLRAADRQRRADGHGAAALAGPGVPVTPEQITESAVACVDAGAPILHLHARDADEAPEWRREAYQEFIPAIRERRPDVVICVTTSGREVAELERRADVLELAGAARSDMASLTLGSLNFRTTASINAPDVIVALAERMAERGIRPELEIFDGQGAGSGLVEHIAQPRLGRASRVVAGRWAPAVDPGRADRALELAAVGQPVLGAPHRTALALVTEDVTGDRRHHVHKAARRRIRPIQMQSSDLSGRTGYVPGTTKGRKASACRPF